MKKHPLKSLLVLLTLICTVPAFTQSNDELKSKISKINQEMAKAMIEGNYEKNLSLYAEDAISMPNNSKMLEGKAAIKKSNEEMIAMGIKIKSFSTTILHVNTCANMVMEIGNFKIGLSVPGVPNDMEEAGKYLTVWEQQADGSLKIKLETWNSDTNPMANTVSDQ